MQGACVKCPPLLDLHRETEVPPEGYVMDRRCRPSCAAPYVNRSRGGIWTCAWCAAPLPRCAHGSYRGGDMCDECLPCDAPRPGFVFVSNGSLDDPLSCRARCTPGTYDRFGFGTCVNHSAPTCAANQFLQPGTAVSDAFCQNCSACAGQRLVQACSPTGDAQCESCGAAPAGARWQHVNGTDCTPVCESGWLRNTASGACERCSDADCGPGLLRPPHPRNCSHCEPCPFVANAVYLHGCTLVCAGGFQQIVAGHAAHHNASIACAPLDSNVEQRVPSPVRVRCEPGHRLNAAYQCEHCDTHVPADSATWQWTGGECEWACADTRIRHQREASVACLRKEELLAETLAEHGMQPTTWQQPSQDMRNTSAARTALLVVLLSVSSIAAAVTIFSLVMWCAQRRGAAAAAQPAASVPENPVPTAV